MFVCMIVNVFVGSPPIISTDIIVRVWSQRPSWMESEDMYT